jgi:hypothetical protein
MIGRSKMNEILPDMTPNGMFSKEKQIQTIQQTSNFNQITKVSAKIFVDMNTIQE